MLCFINTNEMAHVEKMYDKMKDYEKKMHEFNSIKDKDELCLNDQQWLMDETRYLSKEYFEAKEKVLNIYKSVIIREYSDERITQLQIHMEKNKRAIEALLLNTDLDKWQEFSRERFIPRYE